MSETIGKRVKRLRVSKGLSQRDLSSPGVSYAYISRIEAGARQPSVKALRKLANKLGVTVEYLETGSDVTHTDELLEMLRLQADEGTVEIDVGEGVRNVSWVRDGQQYDHAAETLTSALLYAHAHMAELNEVIRAQQSLAEQERLLRRRA